MNEYILREIEKMKSETKVPLVVLYHGNYMDGTGVLLAVKHIFKEHKVTGIPLIYGKYSIEDVKRDTENCNVIMGDFSLTRQEMISIRHYKMNRFVALNHHKSAIETFNGLPYAQVGINESAATMVWKYCSEEPVPSLLSYIKDKDLWEHKLKFTKEINDGISAVASLSPLNLMPYMEDNKELSSLIEIGTAVASMKEATVNKVIESNPVKTFTIDGVTGGFIKNRGEISSVGEVLSLNHSFIAQIFLSDTELVLSLRSNKLNRNASDVYLLCSKYGGGGHKHAGTMSFKYDEIDINRLLKTGDLDKAIRNKWFVRINKFIRNLLGD